MNPTLVLESQRPCVLLFSLPQWICTRKSLLDGSFLVQLPSLCGIRNFPGIPSSLVLCCLCKMLNSIPFLEGRIRSSDALPWPQVRQWLCLRVNQDQEVGRDFKDLFCPSSPLIYVAPLEPSSLSHVVLWFRFQSGQSGLVFVDTSYD